MRSSNAGDSQERAVLRGHDDETQGVRRFPQDEILGGTLNDIAIDRKRIPTSRSELSPPRLSSQGSPSGKSDRSASKGTSTYSTLATRDNQTL